jgi:hypothetical protein
MLMATSSTVPGSMSGAGNAQSDTVDQFGGTKQLDGRYLGLPSGTPASGQVPVATGTGEATAWGTPAGRAGSTLLDSFAGTDDAKMALALAAAAAAGGGTIQLSPRAHTFANQWATTGSQAMPLCIRGAGGVALDASGTTSYGGATTVAMSYSGTGAARMDFQHAGSIEITGILFKDSGGSSVPFFQTTLAVPNIHHNAFVGSATGTACFQDAIVLGGFPGTGSGDTAQYNGYQGAVWGNSFSGIRRTVLLNPAANSVQVYGNTVSFTCGSGLPLGACIEMIGTSTLQVIGCSIYGNCIEENNYPVAIRGTWASYNTIGPNGLFDNDITLYHHYLDANSTHNNVIAAEASGLIPMLIDLALTSTVFVPGEGDNSAQSAVRSQQVFYNGAGGRGPIVMANGRSVLGQDVYGDYGTWLTSFDAPNFPALQAVVFPGSTITDGSTITGTNYATSLTANWTYLDVGVHIRGNNIASGAVIQAAWTAATAPRWQASFAYTAGQVVRPATANSHLYSCTTAGTSGSSQPAFPTGGGTVGDGTAVWTDTGTSSAILFSGAGATATAAATCYFGRMGTAVPMTYFAKHHVISTGSAPSAVPAAGAGAGATAAIAGTDLAHSLTLTTGTSPASGLQCTVTFALPFDAAPRLHLTAVNANTPAAMALVYATKGTTTWTLTATSALTASTAYVFDVVTVQ